MDMSKILQAAKAAKVERAQKPADALNDETNGFEKKTTFGDGTRTIVEKASFGAPCDESFAVGTDGAISLEAGRFKISLGQSLSKDSPIAFTDGRHSVSFYPVLAGADALQAAVVGQDGKSVSFENPAKSLRFSYEAKNKGLKENVIFEAPRGDYSIKYSLALAGLSIGASNEPGEIRLVDPASGDVIFRFGALSMSDASGAASASVAASVTKTSDSGCELSLAPSADWVGSSDRVFPIAVDPAIEIIDDSILKMNYIRGSVSKTSIGEREVIGYLTTNEEFLLFSLDIEDIANQLTLGGVNNFRCLVEFHYDNGVRPASTPGFVICDVSTSAILESFILTKPSGIILLDLTSYVKAAMAAGIQTANFALKRSVEETSVTSSTLVRDYILVYTDASADESLRPATRLEYCDSGSERTDSPSISYDGRRSGTLTASLFSGRIFHEHEDLSIMSGPSQFAVKHVYSPSFAVVSGGAIYQQDRHMGSNWKTNLNQYLVKNPAYDSLLGAKTSYYIDGTGNRHELLERWFYKESGQKEYVSKSDVFLDSDEKLKVKVGSSVFEVEFEATSADGLRLITASDLYGYQSKGDLISSKELCIAFGNGYEYELDIQYDGTIRIPLIYSSPSYLSYKLYQPFNMVKYDGASTPTSLDGSVTYSIEPSLFTTRIYAENGKLFFDYPTTSRLNASGNYGDVGQCEITVARVYSLDSGAATSEVYPTDDLKSVKSQIEAVQQYLSSYETTISDCTKSIVESFGNESELATLTDSDKRILKAARNKIADVSDIKYGSDNLPVLDNNNKTILDPNGPQHTYNSDSDNLETDEDDYSHYIAVQQRADVLAKYKYYLDEYCKCQRQLSDLEAQKAYLESESGKEATDFVVDPSGNILGFDLGGKLVLIEDANKNKIEIAFGDGDDSGRIESVTSASGSIAFHYGDDDLLDYMLDSFGKRIGFTYAETNVPASNDLESNLSGITYQDGTSTSISYTSTTFTATDRSLMETTATFNSSGKISSVFQGVPDATLGPSGFDNGSPAYITAVKDRFSFDVNISGQVSVTDKESRTKTYYLDSLGRAVCVANPSAATNSFAKYDGANLAFGISTDESAVAIGSTNALGTITPTAYSKTFAVGDCASSAVIAFSSLPAAGMAAFEIAFDPTHLPAVAAVRQFHLEVKVTPAVGAPETFSADYFYDGSPLICVPFAFKRPTLSTLSTITVSISAAPSFNASYILTQRIVPCSGTIYGYDADGNLASARKGLTATRYEGYVLGHATKATSTDEFGAKRATQYEYDSEGRLVFSKDWLGNCQRKVYDPKGNLAETREYNEKEPSLAKTSSHVYDDSGILAADVGDIPDPDGSLPKTEYTYAAGTAAVESAKQPNGNALAYGRSFADGAVESVSSSDGGTANSTRLGYTLGFLTSLSHNDFDVTYAYDGRGRKKSVSIAGNLIASYTYNDDYTDPIYGIPLWSKATATQANGFVVSAESDKDGKTTVQTIGGITKYFAYDTLKRLSQITYETAGTPTVAYSYNDYGEIVSTTKTFPSSYVKDAVSRNAANHSLVGSETISYTAGSTGGQVTTFTYDPSFDNRLKSATLPSGETVAVGYDPLGRATSRVGTLSGSELVTEETRYLQNGNRATDLIRKHRTRVKGLAAETTTYSYDVEGNIVAADGNKNRVRYAYDKLNRLVREDNEAMGTSAAYEYDAAGNILSKAVGAYTLDDEIASPTTHLYTYAETGWRDQLAAYDGQACAYDAMGNPTTYLGKALVWSPMGTLTSLTNGSGVASYAYDVDGVRVSKTVSGVLTAFDTLGTRILRMTIGTSTMVFRYLGGEPIGFSYGGSEYFYAKDGQGDVSAVYDSTGALVASYVYDAWGNQKVLTGAGAADPAGSGSVGRLNPFRYRSCFFDEETGLYYLNARYYDPAAGRFLSADATSVLDDTSMQVNGLNLYAYCGGNPVMRTDPMGRLPWWANLLIGIAIVAVLVAATVATAGLAGVGAGAALAAGFTGATFAGSAAAAAVTILSYAAAGAIVGGVSGFVFGGLSIDQNGPHFSLDNASYGLMSGSISGAILGTFMGGVSFVKLANPVLTTAIRSLLGGIGNGANTLCSEAVSGRINPNLILASFLSGGVSAIFSETAETIFSSTATPLLADFISNILQEFIEDFGGKKQNYAFA